MASATSKVRCITCDKGIGQFKCEGCSETFCIKHVVEHRQALNQQLSEITLEYNALQQATNESNSQKKSLIAYIEQWEQKSIDKIRQMAKETRQKVVQFEDMHKKQIVSQGLQNLSKQLKRAREDDDFFETDIQYWMSILKQLNHQLKTTSLSNDIREDETTPLIYEIQIVPSSSKMTSSKDNSEYYEIESDVIVPIEKFDRCYGNAKIEDNGHLITNGNDSFFGTEVRGKVEYTFGKHRLNLKINNNPSKVWMFIGIISKTTRMGGNLFASSSAYGWGDYDDYFLAGQRQKKGRDFYFIYTRENDIIELIIDCEKRTIRYTNTRTKQSQQLNIDKKKCPFPWQLYISLGGRGDQISLLNTITEL